MAIKTAKELLASYNVLDSDKKQNHAHHEFQAFAYRLAHDFRDLEHLKIYMRLARNVERSLMERAYSYALDANTENKGRVFLWKLKALRKEYKDMVNLENYEYEYVAKEMKFFRDEFAPVIFAKTNVYGEIFLPTNPKSKILVINCANHSLLERLVTLGYKLTIFESSRKLKKLLQSKYDKPPKVIGTDFLKNRFKPGTFDTILLNEYWLNIPLEKELDFLKTAKSLLKEGGTLQFLTKLFEDKEEWKKYNYKDAQFKYFIKSDDRSNLLTKLKKASFTILEEDTLPEGILFYLKPL